MTETNYIIICTNIYWCKNRYKLLILSYYMIQLKKYYLENPTEPINTIQNNNITFMWLIIFCWTQIATCNMNMVLATGPFEFLALFYNRLYEMTQFHQHLVHSDYYISFIHVTCHNFNWTSFDINASFIALSHLPAIIKIIGANLTRCTHDNEGTKWTVYMVTPKWQLPR